jgi:hypothetical protein
MQKEGQKNRSINHPRKSRGHVTPLLKEIGLLNPVKFAFVWM